MPRCPSCEHENASAIPRQTRPGQDVVSRPLDPCDPRPGIVGDEAIRHDPLPPGTQNRQALASELAPGHASRV